ncbi:MAG: hypothetical protein LBC25_01255, partial [Holosporales bacterium]|nr:hypothetical protein [Holosporales bacterium]
MIPDEKEKLEKGAAERAKRFFALLNKDKLSEFEVEQFIEDSLDFLVIQRRYNLNPGDKPGLMRHLVLLIVSFGDDVKAQFKEFKLTDIQMTKETENFAGFRLLFQKPDSSTLEALAEAYKSTGKIAELSVLGIRVVDTAVK